MRVLLVVHGFPPAASGGTEIYTRALAHALAVQGDEVFVLAREANPCRPEYSARRGRDGAVEVTWINNTFSACGSFEDSYANPALRQRADTEIERIAPDVVHVQHLTCLSTQIPAAVARWQIPVIVTLNDYWLVCHRGQLLTAAGRRCEGPFDGGCGDCVPAGAVAGAGLARTGRGMGASRVPGVAAMMRKGLGLVEAVTPASRSRALSLARLEHMRGALRHVDLFLAPSCTMAGVFSRFGLPPERLRRCDQGISLAAFEARPREPSQVLRAGFAGTLLPSKAPHLLLEAGASLPAGSVEVDILGEFAPYHGDYSYRQQLEELLAQPFVRRVGPLPHGLMPAALAELDVLVVPSVWIENAPFVIREAFAAKTPVVAAGLGGMAEMVRDGVDGLLFTPGDSAALAAQLKRLQDEPGLLERLCAGIRRPLSIEEDAAALRHAYTDLLRRPRDHGPDRPELRAADAGAVCAVVLNYRTPDQTWLAVRSLQTSRRAPNAILVVDNGSEDASAEDLRQRLRGVELIETGTNLGFSGGCNAGISLGLAQGAELVLLVNSDAVLHPDALAELLDTAWRHPDAGILGPLLLSREEPDRIASAGIRFSPATGRMVHRAHGQRLGQLAAGAAADVDAVSGCVMLVRAGVFSAIGSLDEDYFFSFEDIDFCLRARAAGFRVVAVDGAVAYHQGGLSIGRRSPRRVYFATRNHLRLSSRVQRGSRPAAAARSALIVGWNLAYAVTSPDVPLLRGLAAVARGTWHHVTGRYGSG